MHNQPSVKKNPPQKPPLIGLSTSVFVLTGLITLFGVPTYALTHGFDGWQIAAMLAGIALCEVSITAGYHRLWSHRAYEAHWSVRLILATASTIPMSMIITKTPTPLNAVSGILIWAG